MGNYTAERSVISGIETVRLSDSDHQTQVAIAVGVGNMAYEWKIRGDNFLWFPFDGPAALKAKPALCGIPFLGPWANRLDGDVYWVQGIKYQLNPDLGNIRRDGHQKPIHGLLNFSSKWELLAAASDEESARATSRIEFWKHPEMMAQFPFAHTVTVTHRLHAGAVTVETTLLNHSSQPMPVAIGFHPYFQLPNSRRDDFKLHISATEHQILNELSIPSGNIELIQPIETDLRGHQYDDVYTGLVRNTEGMAEFWVESKGQRLRVDYGPKYNTAVVYAPPGRDYICFEPMAAITNAFNLAHAGIYKELQLIPPGQSWKETFRLSVT